MPPHPPLKVILEAALAAAGEPLSLERLQALFDEAQRPERQAVQTALEELAQEYQGRGLELTEVASGFRLQVPADLAPWLQRLWEERPARYSRALMETLALIAYRQPITRAEIEEVRGVGVSSTIIRTLQERGWIKVLGHREVPGRPALFGTTREFLDYFNLRSLGELPALPDLRDLDAVSRDLEAAAAPPAAGEDIS